MSTINLNDHVKFKVTPESIEVWVGYWSKFPFRPNLVEDVDGWSQEIPLWEYIDIFAEHIKFGYPPPGGCVLRHRSAC